MRCIKCDGQRQKGGLLCDSCWVKLDDLLSVGSAFWPTVVWHKMKDSFDDQITHTRLRSRLRTHVKRG